MYSAANCILCPGLHVLIRGLSSETKYYYDDNFKTYITSKTDALGTTENYAYDNLMRRESITDINNIIWYTNYDESGRVVSTISPGDDITHPTTKIEYIDAVLDTSGNITTPGCIVSMVKESGNNYLEGYTYFDGLGRKIQEKAESTGGLWTTIDYYYNEREENNKKSVPYETISSSFTDRNPEMKSVEYFYDSMGREIKTIYPDGTSSGTIYKKSKIIMIDPNNHASSIEVNGNTRTECSYKGEYPETDPSLPVPYSYAVTTKARGSVTIVDSDGSTIRTGINMGGRKINYEDPDMGEWRYTYDANGNLLTQVDAKGQIIRFEYDPAGRMLFKKYNESTNTTFLYDGIDENGNPDVDNEHGICQGYLTKVIYPYGEESYTYDTRGRVIEQKKTIGSETRTIKIEYDSMDRIIKETYHQE